MKRRTKITPFAKFVIMVLLFLGARYIYYHQDEISSLEIFGKKDSIQTEEKENAPQVQQISMFDTIDLYISQNEKLLKIQSSDTIVEMEFKDTLIYTISSKDSIIGRIIFN